MPIDDIALAADDTSLTADGVSSTRITATVGSPEKGTQPEGDMLLWAVEGGGRVEPEHSRVQNGTASTTVTPSASSEHGNVVVTCTAAGQGVSTSIAIDCTPGIS